MRPRTMQRLRRWHLYVGMIFAPAIIFFAFSGGLQTVELQQRQSSPAWVSTMASVHRWQALARPNRSPRPGENQPPSPIPLKSFVFLLSIGLIATAVLGIVVALANRGTRRVAAIMLAIGIVLPLVLLFV
jgi:hypothetical protein